VVKVWNYLSDDPGLMASGQDNKLSHGSEDTVEATQTYTINFFKLISLDYTNQTKAYEKIHQ